MFFFVIFHVPLSSHADVYQVYEGCRKDYKVNRALTKDQVEFRSTNTPLVCGQHCAGLGFFVSGTQVLHLSKLFDRYIFGV